jgi:hypothetical protein
MSTRASIVASPVLWGLLLGAALGVGLAACASRASVAPTAEMELRKNEIKDYWMQIRQWRVERGWSADPASGMNLSRSIKEIRTCDKTLPKEPSTETCQDICNLKDAICDNAQSICRIAGDLAGDAWADEKCKSAKASCKEATQKCCQCAASERAALPPAQ